MAFVALITGASSGIGEATARRLAREPDVKLVLVARRVQRLDELARALGGATVIALDLTAPGAPERVLEAVQRWHGELHMLVNNAGAAWRGRFGDTGWAGVQRHMELNFEAPVRLTERCCRCCERPRRAPAVTGEGSAFVNVASTASRVSRPDSGAYSAAKFALAGWTDALYGEEREHGIHIGLVLPGFVKTEELEQHLAEILVQRQRRIRGGVDAAANAAFDLSDGDLVGDRDTVASMSSFTTPV